MAREASGGGWGSFGIEVIERAILPEQLPDFSKCFLTGSAEVTPAPEIDRIGLRQRRSPKS
ncbi:hypothetical protein REMIM1_CH03055 [Rhizobium etli bv. mimosae str. Mim1]|nr:hypothetical protein REMIM1_CH03055 [Rhizobium etli bv. mimosae str. Mim1]